MSLRSTPFRLRPIALFALFMLAAPAARLGAAAASVRADSVAPPATDAAAFFAAFLAQRPDSFRVARVTGLVLERDAGRFTLEEGDLWLATPVGGRVCAAVFTGRGSFTLTPPTAGEGLQMQRMYGTTTMVRACSALVIVAADSTIAELRRSLTFRTGEVSKLAVRALDECLRYASDWKTREPGPALAKPFLEGRENGYFFSMIDGVVGGERDLSARRLFLEIDPQRTEEVALWREPKYRHIGFWRVWRRDDVCMFPRGGVDPAVPEGDRRPPLAVRRHRVESRIAGDMGFSAVAEIECESRDTSPQRWAALTLFNRLVVDSVAWSGGRRARFFRDRESDRLWVSCDPPLQPGEVCTLRVQYHGRLIERVGDWMLMGTYSGWYPEPDGHHQVPFDLTFHSPSQYHLVSVGERVSSETQGSVTTTRWRSERPTYNASFVLGLFDEVSFGRPGAPPPVTALMFRGRPEPIRISFGDTHVLSGARMDRTVAADAARAVAFFTGVLGPPPAARIVIAEIPDNKGVAFPGLIQITWTPSTSLRRSKAAAEDAVLRAHEVAHQWWGYGVSYRTYRDHWLSEGFADYAGLWYLRDELGQRKTCLDVLASWREQVFDDLTFRPSGAPPTGPISLGYRSGSVETPANHERVVYRKGAWVLHMLRNMLLDLETGDDGRFADLMRDFYARHEGGKVSTEDFRRVAQRYAGEDLGWFFDQWVHGTELPTYRFASRTERTADGKFKITCRVEQRGVPETFRMPVPIRIDFGGGEMVWVRAPITGATSEFDLPLVDRPPKAVVFNDLESVLCRVERVKW